MKRYQSTLLCELFKVPIDVFLFIWFACSACWFSYSSPLTISWLINNSTQLNSTQLLDDALWRKLRRMSERVRVTHSQTETERRRRVRKKEEKHGEMTLQVVNIERVVRKIEESLFSIRATKCYINICLLCLVLHQFAVSTDALWPSWHTVDCEPGGRRGRGEKREREMKYRIEDAREKGDSEAVERERARKKEEIKH